jgi:hypothetical protein
MLTITDPVQARALADLKCVEQLQFFLRDEHTVLEAASAWKLKLEDAYYRVSKLERLGLIQVTRVSKRAGRDTKHYRAIAEDFFVPLDIVPEMALEVFLGTTNQFFYEMLHRAQARAIHDFLAHFPAGHWGIRIWTDQGGEPDVSLTDQSGHYVDFRDSRMPLIASGWPHLELDFEDAHALMHDLLALMEKYRGKRGAGKYLLHFAAAPLSD